VVDAYCGVGIFAACAADPSARVVAIERSPAALADARHNLAGRDVKLVAGEVGRWRARRGEAIDLVLADPARTGLGRPGVQALAGAGAPVLVLVSCDPASLGRDSRLLAGAGYRHERTLVVDTFPHTTQVEAVTRFALR
jgi:23S rRNA (uracil1939-C5)-methyltransferase